MLSPPSFLKLPGFVGESLLNLTFNRLVLKLAPVGISLLNIVTYHWEDCYGEGLTAHVVV